MYRSSAALLHKVLSVSAPFLLAFSLAHTSAQAGVIRVIVDNFNGTALASPGTQTVTLLGNPDNRAPAFTVNTTGGTYGIDLGGNVSADVLLSYGNVSLPTGATARLSYIVTFSNVGTNPASANGVGNQTTISVSGGAPTSYGNLPTLVDPNGITTTVDFFGGPLNLLFKAVATRAWDLSIDSLELSITCAAAGNATYDVTGTSAAPISGLVGYATSAPRSCAVPVASSAWLLLGGAFSAFGLAGFRRRRSA